MAVARRRRRPAEDEDEAPRRPRRAREEPKEEPKNEGLSVKTYSGLSEKRMAAKSGGNNSKIFMMADKPVTVQFLTAPDKFLEYDLHCFKESGGWKFVPCAGEECPLDQDEDREVSKTTYTFAALAWDCTRKQVGIIEGRNGLAMRIMKKYKMSPEKFLKRTWEITKLDILPKGQFDVEMSEEPYTTVPKDKWIDLEDWVQKEMQRYYGDDMPGASTDTKRRTSLDDDDDEPAEDDESYSRTELKAMTPRALKKVAIDLDIDVADMSTRSMITAILEEQEQ